MSLTPTRGGVDTYVETLTKVLIAAGMDVHVLVYNYTFSDEGIPTVPIILHRVRLKYIPYFSTVFPTLYEAWRVYRSLRSLDNHEHFDVIEGANDEGMMVFIAPAFRSRFWMRLHTSIRQHIVNKRQTLTWRRRFVVWMDRVAARQTSNLVTHSEIHRAEMMPEYGLDQAKIAIVPHAVNAPQAVACTGDIRTIAYIGTLDLRKGIDLFLSAGQQIARENPDLRILVIGRDGGDSGCQSWKSWFERQYSNPEVQTRLHFMGPISDDELQELWANIDLVVVPSRYESFGLVVIEAFARGKPVVVTDGGGALVEVASGSALVVEQTPEAIAYGVRSIMYNTALAERLGKDGHKTYESKYTLERMQENVLKLYGFWQDQGATRSIEC
jgi:glycosyltransferase involved in cell wall biosynthesis